MGSGCGGGFPLEKIPTAWQGGAVKTSSCTADPISQTMRWPLGPKPRFIVAELSLRGLDWLSCVTEKLLRFSDKGCRNAIHTTSFDEPLGHIAGLTLISDNFMHGYPF